jgi:hypothetical protein
MTKNRLLKWTIPFLLMLSAAGGYAARSDAPDRFDAASVAVCQCATLPQPSETPSLASPTSTRTPTPTMLPSNTPQPGPYFNIRARYKVTWQRGMNVRDEPLTTSRIISSLPYNGVYEALCMYVVTGQTWVSKHPCNDPNDEWVAVQLDYDRDGDIDIFLVEEVKG